MKCLSIPHLVLAATLLVVLPLQPLYCACTGSQGHSTPAVASSYSGHERCASRSQCVAESHSQPERGPHSCTCAQIGVVALPPVIETGLEAPTVVPLAVLTVPEVIAPGSVVTEAGPALDVGSSRLPVDPGAHGLRAPPTSA